MFAPMFPTVAMTNITTPMMFLMIIFYLSSRQEWKTTKSTVSQMRLKPRLSNTKLTRVFDVEIMQYEINKNS